MNKLREEINVNKLLIESRISPKHLLNLHLYNREYFLNIGKDDIKEELLEENKNFSTKRTLNLQ